MAKIPFNLNTTKNAIENAPPSEEWPRNYVGMSALGSDCLRKVWYEWRWANIRKIAPRLKRIFERGNIEEARIIRDLNAVGIEVFRRDGSGHKHAMTGAVGEHQEELIGFAGHAMGHPDGRALGVIEAPKTEHTLELKTMADKYWKVFASKGVKVSHPSYYAQLQIYMRRMKTDRALFIATNKDNESREYERVYADKEKQDELERIEFSLISSEVPFGRKFVRTDYRCKMCDQFATCHDDSPPMKTCRSCAYAAVAMGGEWVCEMRNDEEISIEKQREGCGLYKRGF